MKIGILTFHRAHNYGAMLQAYALRHVLQRKGHDVEFISYRQPKIEEAYRSWLWTYDPTSGVVANLKSLVANVIMWPKRYRRRHAFVRFASVFLPETRKYDATELRTENLGHDRVFFGSDQIWTTRFLGDFDSIYWGDIRLDKGKKIAYAPSMELRELTTEQEDFIRPHLENFDMLSAREISMAKMLSDISGKQLQVVLDPTLLCSFEEYLPLVQRSRRVPANPYILVYQVGSYPKVRAIAQKISCILHYPIIEIASTVALYGRKGYKECYGPDDFVALIANAAFVVSCSFHGTAFSVIFKKQFVSVLIESADSRAISFLSQINLMDKGIRDEGDVTEDVVKRGIDYTFVYQKLDELKSQSLKYIDDAING